MIIEYSGQEAYIPNAKHIMKTLRGESIFVFGCDKDKFYTCAGIGTVVKVEHGQELDMVTMYFGRVSRSIVVKNNHARRQIYTLKKGQLAWFFGMYKYYEGGKKIYFYAKGFQAWYVPKALDIKNYDLDSIDEMQNETSLLNFLDQFEEK